MVVTDLTAIYGIDCRTFDDEAIKGDDYTRIIKVTGLNLTDYIGRFYWLDNGWDQQSSRVIISTNQNIAVTNLDAVNLSGEYEINITAEQTNSLIINKHYYGDLELNDGNRVITACRIKLYLRGESSRDYL